MNRSWIVFLTILLVAALVVLSNYPSTVAAGQSGSAESTESHSIVLVIPTLGSISYTPTPFQPTVDQPTLQPTAQGAVQVQFFGSLVQLPSGRSIDLYQAGNGKNVILIIGNIHGGNEQNTYTLVQKLVDSINDGSIVVPSNVTVYLVPTMNPDGLSLGVSSAGRFNTNNVDLNRNWGSNNWTATSTWGNTQTYGGSAPFSETETQTIRDLILLLQPRSTLFFHCCQRNGLMYANDQSVANGGDAAYRTGSGYVYNAGDPTVTGDAIDWMSQIAGLPGFEVELPLSTRQTAIDWGNNGPGLQAFFNWAASLP